MVYTEIKEKNGKKYYYRVKNVREGSAFRKERVYLGSNLNKKSLKNSEEEADKRLLVLTSLLSREELRFLQKIKKDFEREPNITFENRYEAFCSLFTYDSTTIEGNTLTLQETTRLLFEGIVPPRKPLREIYEVLNHKSAFDYLLRYRKNITNEFICELHRLIVLNTLSPELSKHIGRYRNVQVYIRGVRWFPPTPSDVHSRMTALLTWYAKNKKKLHPVVVASHFHTEFEKIHPFVDGNGRVGRLLLNFILHKNSYPMINIPSAIKHRYYDALEKAQVNGNLRPFIALLLDIFRKKTVRF